MTDAWDQLNLVELLDLLEPVPEPPPISMMPQTEGWIWLGAVLLIGTGAAIRHILKRRRRNAYRRAALRELQACSGDVAGLAGLVRRTALAAYPRKEVASLHGRDWLVFLDRSYGGDAFENGAGQLLGQGTYGKGVGTGEDTLRSLRQLVETWIRRHGGGAP